MEFNIKGIVKNLHQPDTFEVIIRVMHGDADSYESITIGPFIRGTDEAKLQDLIETLDRMDAEYPHGRGGGTRDNYDNVEGFFKWFGVDEDGENTGISGCYWPVDPYDYETHGDPDKVTVRYFDDKLTECEVEVVK